MRYYDFDLHIGPRDSDGYYVHARADKELRAGGIKGHARLDPDDPELRRMLDLVARRQTNERLLTRLGDTLYTHLFFDELRELLDESFGEVHGRGQSSGLRLRLEIGPAALAALPWEFLHSRSRGFLGARIQSPLIRYLEIRRPIPRLEVEFPLRLLVALPETPDLAAAQERAHIEEALAPLKRNVRATFLDGEVSLERLRDALRGEVFHVFHFIGHGIFRDERAFLVLHDESGQPYLADQAEIAALFANQPDLKLVVLNSCCGASVSASEPLVGMAPGLVASGVPAVVAMQHPIDDRCAVAFAREFYKSLFGGFDSGRIDLAMSRARAHLADRFRGERDLGSPVLFMRAPEGLLFDARHASRAHRLLAFIGSLFSRREGARQGALYRTRADNVKSWAAWYSETGDPAALEQQHVEEQEYARLRRRIRFRNRLLMTSAVSVLVMFVLSFLKLLDMLNLDTTLESYTIGLGGLLAQTPLREEIVLVTSDREFSAASRAGHAALIERLSQLGARVIAFDLFFDQPAPVDPQGELAQATARMRAAIEAAEARGTTIILGTFAIEDARPQMDRRLARATAATVHPEDGGALAGYGLLCLGTKLGLARTAVLAVEKPDGDVHPSLALSAYAAFIGAERFMVAWSQQRIDLVGPSVWQSSSFSEIGSGSRGRCHAIGERDRTAELLIDASPLAVLRAPERNARYEDVIGAEDGLRFANRIVLVGERTDRELLPVFGGLGEARFGIEVHADALNALLHANVIRRAGRDAQLAAMTALALIGAFIRFWTPPQRIWSRRTWLLVSIGVYLAGAAAWYVHARVMLNPAYPIGAMLLAYWLTGMLERRMYRTSMPRGAEVPKAND